MLKFDEAVFVQLVNNMVAEVLAKTAVTQRQSCTRVQHCEFDAMRAVVWSKETEMTET